MASLDKRLKKEKPIEQLLKELGIKYDLLVKSA